MIEYTSVLPFIFHAYYHDRFSCIYNTKRFSYNSAYKFHHKRWDRGWDTIY